MVKRYSIAQARHDLAAIVHELEQQQSVELTRRGEPVAVMLSVQEYRRLLTNKGDFWTTYMAFCAEQPLDTHDLDAFLHTLRDPSPGRDIHL
jgi:prevent-host-death family protein